MARGSQAISAKRRLFFTLKIYSPDGDLIRSAINITSYGLTVEALKTGRYRVDVENPNPESISPFIYIRK